MEMGVQVFGSGEELNMGSTRHCEEERRSNLLF